MNKSTDIWTQLDAMIQEERSHEVNPYLSVRVLAKLEKPPGVDNNLWWKTILAVASLVLVVWMGWSWEAGSPRQEEEVLWLVNDDQSEHLAVYLQPETEKTE